MGVLDDDDDDAPQPTRSAPRRIRRLSTWDQASIRAYSSLVFCFPFDNIKAGDALEHIELALKRMRRARPEFAGRLQLGSAEQAHTLFLYEYDEDQIQLDVLHSQTEFGCTFAQLKERGFPQSLFVHPRFSFDGSVPNDECSVPVVRVQVVFIHGGLLLSVNLHHALFDGDCMRLFNESFAAFTRGETGPDLPKELEAPIPEPKAGSTLAGKSTEELIRSCPEYKPSPKLTGPQTAVLEPGGTHPIEIEKTGRIFVFRRQKLKELQDLMESVSPTRQRPSTFMCIAALTWVYTTQARTATEDLMHDVALPEKGSLIIPIDWKKRAFKNAEWAKNYFGNATISPATKIPLPQLLAASQDDKQLADVTRQVQETIESVNDDFVSQRNEMYAAVPDFRLLGLDMDPRFPHNMIINTWRFVGADTEWGIPGIQSKKAEAVRRAMGQWSMSRGLVLPGREEAEELEVLVTLPKASMESLVEDKRWLRWVDGMVAHVGRIEVKGKGKGKGKEKEKA